jgi:hypothetical protein
MTEQRSPAADLDTLIRELRVDEFVDSAHEIALLRMIADYPAPSLGQVNAQRLPRYGLMFESRAIAAYSGALAEPATLERARSAFEAAFQCWRALASLPASDEMPRVGTLSVRGVGLISGELSDNTLSPTLSLALRVAVCGIAAGRTAETRLELERFEIAGVLEDAGWRDQVIHHVVGAFVRLVRKAGGWNDIYAAIESIDRLRSLQQRFEEQYLESAGDAAHQTVAAVELVGLYHLAQLVTVTGEYLRVGEDSSTQALGRIDRHRERARVAFLSGRDAIFAHIADLMWVGARELVQNAIWTHLSGVGERVKEFGRLLAARGRSRPVIELWPSQQAALRKNLLDPYKRAILVEMPTSAGKTLLAKFAIVQSRVLNPNGTVAYIVPTRALVNQVTLDLREDLRLVDLRVEQAVPATEIDPSEDKLLGEAPDVLVSTPEKLDLLIRRDHPVVQNVALVIADEAHNLRDGDRGARLEMLLAMIKRDRADARFLLLSPFLPNDTELTAWLGDDRALAPIKVDWKPSSRMVGAIRVAGRAPNSFLAFETLPASDNVDVGGGHVVPIGDVPSKGAKSIRGLTKAAISALRHRGSILVLCEGPGTAATRARQIADDLQPLPTQPDREAVCHYLEAEIGRPTALVDHIRRGVAYHHAGLSHEARWLIEGLIRRNLVDIVCGTTTLAQGVNFPIASVVIETLDKGIKTLSYEDFWNIAGRAGRALVDTSGIVAFPTPDRQKKEEYTQFLRGEAQAISSQLATLIERADEIVKKDFGISAIFAVPELHSFLQFLAHAMRVSGTADIADEVEDLLRASLVYRQAQKRGEESAQTLVTLCRAYLAKVRGQADILALADQTGFATPSVLQLRMKTRGVAEFQGSDRWNPTRLFGDDVVPLAERVRAIADLPEMRLGPGKNQPFNATRIAEILRDWVNGESLGAMAQSYPMSEGKTEDQRVAEFSKYLHSQLLGRASWGMGALGTVCLSGEEGTAREEAGYVPSMIFFGVRQKEAVWLRMVGVPRVVADGLAAVWKNAERSAPKTYDEIRAWVSKLSDRDWSKAIPDGAALSPSEARLLWHEFSGEPRTPVDIGGGAVLVRGRPTERG